jgi:fructoselysine transporter
MRDETFPTPDASELKPRLGLASAIALNMSQMCGAGPFITIPAMVVMMGGPQAMLGWLLGALLSLCDGLVWAELGAAMPGSGGTYIYLREAFGKRSGTLLPFLFVWTAMLFIPMTMATGVMGFVQYVGWFFPHMSGVLGDLLGLGLIWVTIGLLWRTTGAIGRLGIVLWVIMLASIACLIVASLTHFDAARAFRFPHGAFDLGNSAFWFGLAGSLTIGTYDYLGYNTTAYLGAEIKHPGSVIPTSIVFSILGMFVVYFTMQVGILGVVDWHRMLDPQSAAFNAVASVVLNETWGPTAANVVTVLILITTGASVFAGILGGSRVPYEAARDGVFFRSFAQIHRKLAFPTWGLLSMGILTSLGFIIGRLTSLATLIQLLTTVMILVQSVAQILALFALRREQPGMARPYKMWLYPLPALIALIGWLYIYVSSNKNAPGAYPIQWSLAWLVLGSIAHRVWTRTHGLRAKHA